MCVTGNHQMCRLGQQQQHSLFCPFDLPVRYHRGDQFESVHYIQVSSTPPAPQVRSVECLLTQVHLHTPVEYLLTLTHPCRLPTLTGALTHPCRVPTHTYTPL